MKAWRASDRTAEGSWCRDRLTVLGGEKRIFVVSRQHSGLNGYAETGGEEGQGAATDHEDGTFCPRSSRICRATRRVTAMARTADVQRWRRHSSAHDRDIGYLNTMSACSANHRDIPL